MPLMWSHIPSTSHVSPSDVDLIRTKGYREGFIQPTRLMPKLGGTFPEMLIE